MPVYFEGKKRILDKPASVFYKLMENWWDLEVTLIADNFEITDRYTSIYN